MIGINFFCRGDFSRLQKHLTKATKVAPTAVGLKAPWVVLLALLTSACSQSLDDYATRKPRLDLKEYFQGEIKAWGVVTDRSGTVKRRFTATIHASWQDNRGTLDEHFLFDDGEKQQRIWTLYKDGQSYRGTAGDVIGEAAGQAQGFAMNWAYTLQVMVDGEPWQIQIDDWLYQLDEKVLFNQGEMSKFGIKVGQITLFMQRQ